MKRKFSKTSIVANFKNSFPPAVITEWNNFDVNTCNCTTCNVFKNSILKFIRPEPNQGFDIHNIKILLITTHKNASWTKPFSRS